MKYFWKNMNLHVLYILQLSVLDFLPKPQELFIRMYCHNIHKSVYTPFSIQKVNLRHYGILNYLTMKLEQVTQTAISFTTTPITSQ